jgi:hypothetical protein
MKPWKRQKKAVTLRRPKTVLVNKGRSRVISPGGIRFADELYIHSYWEGTK